MSWIKIDDGMVDHPKIEPLTDAAFRWLHKGLSYANRFLTNGLLPQAFTSKVPAKIVTELTTVRDGESNPVWHRATDGTIRIHNFKKYQLSKAYVLRERRQTKTRVAKWRAKHQNSNGVGNGVTNGVSNGAPVPSRPVPSRTTKKNPPYPPTDVGGPRVLRKHKKAAEVIHHSWQGYCRHQPKCATTTSCVALLAQEQALKDRGIEGGERA